MGWQTIESAPKDGTELLLFEAANDRYSSLGLGHKRYDLPGGVYTGLWSKHGGWTYSFMGRARTHDDYFGDCVNPTHWAPLPSLAGIETGTAETVKRGSVPKG